MKNWNYKDFDIFNDLENRKNSTHNKVGGDKSGKVEYKFNELGFRGDSLETYHKSKKKFVVFGCSHTAGIGNELKHTWVQRISDRTGHKYINCGIQGISNDTISRAVLSYTEYLKPDFVIVLHTYPHRREYTTSEGRKCSYKPDGKWDFWETTHGNEIHDSITFIQNDENDLDNQYRNMMLVKYYLRSLNIPLLQYKLEDYQKLQVDNDLVGSGHCGIETNKNFSIKVIRDWIKLV
jgi:hypothetical protein